MARGRKGDEPVQHSAEAVATIMARQRYSLAAVLRVDPDSEAGIDPESQDLRSFTNTLEYHFEPEAAAMVMARLVASAKRSGHIGEAFRSGKPDFFRWLASAADHDLDPAVATDPGKWKPENEDERLVISREQCKKCKEFRVISISGMAATRMDEGEKTIYMCLACRNSWQ
jgi:DNA-directed RNA polymerase subunit M/transcription elongation factor TFIIS